MTILAFIFGVFVGLCIGFLCLLVMCCLPIKHPDYRPPS